MTEFADHLFIGKILRTLPSDQDYAQICEALNNLGQSLPD